MDVPPKGDRIAEQSPRVLEQAQVALGHGSLLVGSFARTPYSRVADLVSCYDRGMKPSLERPARGLVPSALLGAASGMRSTAGLAAVIVIGKGDALPAFLQHRLAKPAAGAALAIELVLDKMPFTGSRLEPAGMAGRLVFAGAAAGLPTREKARPVVPAVLVAVAAAAVSAKVTHDLRAFAAKKLPDLVIAVGEDLAAVRIAALGCRMA